MFMMWATLKMSIWHAGIVSTIEKVLHGPLEIDFRCPFCPICGIVSVQRLQHGRHGARSEFEDFWPVLVMIPVYLGCTNYTYNAYLMHIVGGGPKLTIRRLTIKRTKE